MKSTLACALECFRLITEGQSDVDPIVAVETVLDGQMRRMICGCLGGESNEIGGVLVVQSGDSVLRFDIERLQHGPAARTPGEASFPRSPRCLA